MTAIGNPKKPIILSILFFLPIVFLLFLYPATHNYDSLDIVKTNILELNNFTNTEDKKVKLQGHITVLGFLGNKIESENIKALNVKELIYDKFQGFKKFQVVFIVNNDFKDRVEPLIKDLNRHGTLKYLHLVYGSGQEIENLYNSLQTHLPLPLNTSSKKVYIIDKERNQRARLDDREKHEIDRKMPIYSLYGYSAIEIDELKNKMSEDMRVLFTEYRQKRKGNFNSTIRRAEDLKYEH